MELTEKKSNRRKYPRLKFDGKFKGGLSCVKNGNSIDFSLLDFSTAGIGILSDQKLLPNSEFKLTVEEYGDYILSIVWAMPVKRMTTTPESNEKSYQYGLKLSQPSESLYEKLKEL